ncbi:protein translocase subunit SecDF [Bacteroides sp. 519]|uniref:protein translocase subunit SecDF n=1 Tax=Bacteroides sp. 519 TaxID=2302937 RepID=UPI0013D64AD2|nr:protein translocase subunit SecDF [Bacteroides sp. 519]NDV57604.1 protein translocase subunit SecDF [Bacteroides sp. 519]
MQNKGIVKVFAVLLTLVCAFYLSFTFVTSHWTSKAKEYANGDPTMEQHFLDSMANKKVYLGVYTLKQTREMEIGLGLDLKGGMNVILEVSVADVVKALADNKPDAAFNQAVAAATALQTTSQDDFVTLFVREYHKVAPGAKLSELFATQKLKDKVSQRSSDAEVEKVLREEIQSAIDNSYNVLRTRIDRFGVVQPNIQKLEDKMGRIMVELPGIKEPERVRKLLQGSANLEFWETYPAQEIVPVLNTADAKLRAVLSHDDDTTEGAATDTTATSSSIKDDIQSALQGDNPTSSSTTSADARKYNPLTSILQVVNNGPIVGYATARDTAEVNRLLAMKEVAAGFPKDLRLKWGVAPANAAAEIPLYELYAIKSTERSGKAPLEGDVVDDAKNDYDQYGKPSVSMAMNTEGSRKWALLTRQNVGKSVAIVLDGYVYSAPNVNNEITGGRSQITGNFTPEQAKDLANVLKSGKMPAPAHIVQEDIIGPSLGAESIQAGFISFVVALVLLMIYMCVIYGLVPGLIANAALIINLFFTLGVLASFQAALTMSGIAGMVLTLGMAVDANVLIYERIKEELRAGKGIKKAVADGYSNAFSAIFDSNFTSLITGVILFSFGTGPIRGFATTLMIGIIMSFFTAVFLTRVVYEYFLNKDKLLNLSFTSAISKNILINPKFDFMGKNKMSLTITGVIIAVCVVLLVFKGLNQGIDFTGGRNYKVQFVDQVEPEAVRSLLESSFDGANVSVIAIGADKRTVRISTNYRIEENSSEVDSEIEAYIYQSLKPLLTENISLETFIDRDNHTGGSIISSQKVGPSIADDIKTSAFWSVLLSLVAIGLYILLRFRNVSYSIGSVVALTSDTLMILGAYSLLWGILPISLEVDQTFIGAILTAIGYSINDKVVIFDRVREYFGLYPKRATRQLFNDSLNSTLNRTINTSLSTLIVLLCIFILGGDSIRSFSFAMILGVIFGTISSLFIASPVAYLLMGKKKQATEE